jgi:single-strand DNA-binding protein
MANFNKVLLMGNLTRDPELRTLPSGTSVADFGLAVNRTWNDGSGQKREATTFVDCKAMGRQAEVIKQYFEKGKPIFVEGRLDYSTWEAKDGSGKRSKLEVFIENFQFVGSPGRRDEGGPQSGGSSRPQSRNQSYQPQTRSNDEEPPTPFSFEEDVPF